MFGSFKLIIQLHTHFNNTFKHRLPAGFRRLKLHSRNILLFILNVYTDGTVVAVLEIEGKTTNTNIVSNSVPYANRETDVKYFPWDSNGPKTAER